VDQYQLLISSTTVEGGKAEATRIAELQKIVGDKYSILDRAKKRAEWVKHQEDQRMKKQEQEEAERKEYSSIDWDDFQVIGEIFFTESDETYELPGPTSLNDLQSASLEQRGKVSRQLIEEAMPTEDMAQWQQNYHTPAPPVQQPFQQPAPMQMPYGPTPPAQPAFSPPPAIPQFAVPDETSRSASPAVPAPKRIVQNAAPRAAARRGRVTMATCPNCKLQIPYDELEQHMKSKLHRTPPLLAVIEEHANVVQQSNFSIQDGGSRKPKKHNEPRLRTYRLWMLQTTSSAWRRNVRTCLTLSLARVSVQRKKRDVNVRPCSRQISILRPAMPVKA
jgi:splicing factor 3A subunit 1